MGAEGMMFWPEGSVKELLSAVVYMPSPVPTTNEAEVVELPVGSATAMLVGCRVVPPWSTTRLGAPEKSADRDDVPDAADEGERAKVPPPVTK